VDKSIVDEVKRSWGRALGNADLMKDFYHEVIDSHPIIAKLFARTNPSQQQEVLKQSLSMAILFPQNNLIAQHAMARVRNSHCRDNLNIQPEFYDSWLNALLRVISKSDPEFNSPLEQKWREVLGCTIRYIREGY